MHALAVDDRARQPEALGAAGDALAARRVLGRHADRVAVVLAEEDDGQRPDPREVEALVEDALVDRAVAEDGDGDGVEPAPARGERHADRERDRPADHRVGPEEADVDVGGVHRPALAARDAGAAPEQLGEQADGIDALGQGVAVPAVVREHDVVRRSAATAPTATASWPIDAWIVPAISPASYAR